MKNNGKQNGHLKISAPSGWVRRFAVLVREGGAVLDMACGGGRHARHLLDLGFKVTAIDRDVAHVAHVADIADRAEVIAADLEGEVSVFGANGPLAGRRFAGIVVSNYLHRPLLEDIMNALEEGGVLIYETFARGNESYNRPRNPDHLLRVGELLQLVRGRLQVVAYEHGVIDREAPSGVKQRLCAVNDLHLSKRQDGEAEPHRIG